MGRERKDSFSVAEFKRDVLELTSLADVLRILTEGEGGKEAAVKELASIIGDRVDALAEAVHEARG